MIQLQTTVKAIKKKSQKENLIAWPTMWQNRLSCWVNVNISSLLGGLPGYAASELALCKGTCKAVNVFEPVSRMWETQMEFMALGSGSAWTYLRYPFGAWSKWTKHFSPVLPSSLMSLPFLVTLPSKERHPYKNRRKYEFNLRKTEL